MPKATLADKLVVAISSRALFDLSESHRIFTEQGVDAYQRYQIAHEDELLAPGPAFTLVKKLLRLNRPEKQYVEVILLSRNSADTGLRVFNAIKHYGLDISRAAFTKGEPTSRYVPAFGSHLFLSADTEDVRRALDEGSAAATIFSHGVQERDRRLLLRRSAHPCRVGGEARGVGTRAARGGERVAARAARGEPASVSLLAGVERERVAARARSEGPHAQAWGSRVASRRSGRHASF